MQKNKKDDHEICVYPYICMRPGTRYKGYARVRIHVFIPGTRCCYTPTLWRGVNYKYLNNCKKEKQLHPYIHTYCTGDLLVPLHIPYYCNEARPKERSDRGGPVL